MTPETTLPTLLPALLMFAATGLARGSEVAVAWRRFQLLALAATAAAAVALGQRLAGLATWLPPGFAAPLAGAWVALLVQALGTVIGAFSSRYLQGEAGQLRYVASLGTVLGAVQLLLLADHWLVLIAAWAAIGIALQRLLCFYADRPFARLAAHKKRLADRLADLLLVIAALLAWRETGSGSLSELWRHLEAGAPSFVLQASAICLVLAVLLRTALMPVHGWLMQVMEAPTPVSALLHAGVVNLGGYVLVRFSPLLEAVPASRWLLVGAGLATALLAGLVMLTRVSIKVRLAWSTAAQMGFMVLECGLGLYMLALLHLMGHSLYKAHAFLAASGAVRQTRLRQMNPAAAVATSSLLAAPLATAAVVALVTALVPGGAWPHWWSGVLAFAWAPLLWWSASPTAQAPGALRRLLTGAALVAGLTAAALAGHALPFGVQDAPEPASGLVALIGMVLLYAGLSLMQARPHALAGWRRWSYAGFYLDEVVTRAALRLWPAHWAPGAHSSH